MLTRRLWLAGLLTSCVHAQTPRLRSRPGKDVKTPGKKGLQPLGLRSERDGLFFVPEKIDLDEPAPLLVMLHGATGKAERAIRLVRQQAEAAGVILLVPESRDTTWDAIRGDFGSDVDFIDRALKLMFESFRVDRKRLAIGGFSDGATYALSLGLPNGDLFTHVIAFSPGFIKPAPREGDPKIFISHGTNDQILPIDHCSRRIAPVLKSVGYSVDYREFEGPHTVPAEMASAAMNWFSRKS